MRNSNDWKLINEKFNLLLNDENSGDEAYVNAKKLLKELQDLEGKELEGLSNAERGIHEALCQLKENEVQDANNSLFLINMENERFEIVEFIGHYIHCTGLGSEDYKIGTFAAGMEKLENLEVEIKNSYEQLQSKMNYLSSISGSVDLVKIKKSNALLIEMKDLINLIRSNSLKLVITYEELSILESEMAEFVEA